MADIAKYNSLALHLPNIPSGLLLFILTTTHTRNMDMQGMLLAGRKESKEMNSLKHPLLLGPKFSTLTLHCCWQH